MKYFGGLRGSLNPNTNQISIPYLLELLYKTAICPHRQMAVLLLKVE